MREYACLLILFGAIALKEKLFRSKQKSKIEKLIESEEEPI